MITLPLKLKQIAVSSDHIFGLDEEGTLWYRTKLPYAHTTVYNNDKKKKEQEEEAEAKKMWKRMSMFGRIGEEIPEAKEIPPELVGLPVVNPKPEQVDPLSVDTYLANGLGVFGFEE